MMPTSAAIEIPVEMILAAVFSIVGFIIVSLIGLVGFFLSRHMTSTDGDRQSIDNLHSRMGLVEAAMKRSKEADDECRDAIADLQKELQKLNVQVAVLEAHRDGE